MIGIAPTLAASSLLAIADSVFRRVGAGPAGGIVHGLVLGVLRTPVAGPVLGSMMVQFENLARAGLLVVTCALGVGGAAALLVALAFTAYQDVVIKVRTIARNS
jgi:cytochrome c biogenesis protein CcdA